jgi:hypothetical protein
MVDCFVIGMIAGFFIGVGFCLLFTSILAHKMIKILSNKKEPEDTFDPNDPTNYWKPKGWKPNEED